MSFLRQTRRRLVDKLKVPSTQLILMAIGIVSVIAGVYFHHQFLKPIPGYAQIAYDPETAYFMNSLSVLKGRPYAYYHHPGVPLMLIGTAISFGLKFAWGLPSDEFIQVILANPRPFFLLAEASLVLLSAICVLSLLRLSGGRGKWPGPLLAAGIAVSYFAALPQDSFRLVVSWTQNSFPFPAGVLLLALLGVRLSDEPRLGWLEVFSWGVGAGVLWSVQFYFAAWVFGVVAALTTMEWLASRSVLRTAGTAVLAGLGGVAGFGLMFLPLLHKAREYTWWIRGRIFGGGVDTGGFTIFSEGAVLLEALRGVWSGRWELLALLLCLSLLIIYSVSKRGRPLPRSWWALLVGALSTLVVAHFAVLAAAIGARPGYQVALAAVVPILAWLAFDVGQDQPISRYAARAIAALLVVGFLLAAALQVISRNSDYRQYLTRQAALQQALQSAAQSQGVPQEDLRIIWTYGAPASCYGLRFGNIYTDRSFNNEINQLCRDEWGYEAWSNQLTSSEGTTTFPGDSDWDVIIGPPSYLPDLPDQVGEAARLEETGLEMIVTE